MDFDLIDGIEVQSYRIATIDLITHSSTSGDAYLVCPNGQRIDLAWRSEQPESSARWSPPTIPGSLGVITVAITPTVEADDDLRPVLEAAAALMEPILAAGIDLLR